MHSQVVKAREAYFEKHPFDPNKNALLSHDETGMPVGFLTLPDMGELSIVSMKFGYEFLAHVRTDDDVDSWLGAVMKAAGSPDLAGIMFAHAFRGISGLLAQLIDSDPGLAEVMRRVAAEGWEKEF